MMTTIITRAETVAPKKYDARIVGVIGEKMQKAFYNDLTKIVEASPSEINILINSNGGYMEPAYKITAAIQALVRGGVKVKCFSPNAASGAFMALAACSERYLIKDGSYLFHNIFVVIDCKQFEKNPKTRVLCTAKGFYDLALEIQADDIVMHTIINNALHMDPKEYRIRAEAEKPIEAWRLLERGFATEIIKSIP